VSNADELRTHLQAALADVRASRNRLDVQSLDALTWDDLADVDNYLGEAVEALKRVVSEMEK
jgi:hypothetical protein